MMDSILHAVEDVLYMTAVMGWQILWGLVFGFLLSAIIDVLVSKAELQKLMPDNSARSVSRASLLGAASSSCSYAAVAIARSIVRKGGDFTAAMAFEFASTNLVLELGILLLVLMGGSFTAAEFIGGPLMIVIMVFLFRIFLKPAMIEAAKRQADKGLRGQMEGHAQMSMEARQGTWKERLTSASGWTAISHSFVMNWQMLWKDIAVGLLISGTLGALVPAEFWQSVFFTHDPLISKIWGPLIGPFIAIASFTCSIGNVPLAVVLWNGGISFGGVVAFIFADLIIIPILNIYRKYYGLRMSLFLLLTFYISMVLAAFAIEMLFGALNWIPSSRSLDLTHASFSLNYTTFFNGLALLLAGWLYARYRSSGGPQMMKTMKQEGMHGHHH